MLVLRLSGFIALSRELASVGAPLSFPPPLLLTLYYLLLLIRAWWVEVLFEVSLLRI